MTTPSMMLSTTSSYGSSSIKSNANGSNNNSEVSLSSNAISRSTELLSCAKTALKIEKSEHEQKMQQMSEQQQQAYMLQRQRSKNTIINFDQTLELHKPPLSMFTSIYNGEVLTMLEDSISLLRAMYMSLNKLQNLVRRRGHTNDPTIEISYVVKQLESDTSELTLIINTVKSSKSLNKQHRKHLDYIANWISNVTQQQTNKLKDILKIRSDVLADQAERRKLLQPGGSNSTATTSSSSGGGSSSIKTQKQNAFNSPLFMTPTKNPYSNSSKRTTMTTSKNRTGTTAPPLYGGNSSQNSSVSQAVAPSSLNGSMTTTSSGYGGYNRSTSGGYGGYGGGSGYYGGGGNGSGSTGMRQRKTAGGSSSAPSSANNYYHQQQQQQDDDNYHHQQQQEKVQTRVHARKTKERLEEARQAETTLTEITKLFGKMSTLITQQSEVIENIEDDVESAMIDVSAGQDEIIKLHKMKKGNRGLIIKTFAIVIFMIVFMKLYKR